MFVKHCALVLERVIVYSKRESYLEKAKERRKIYIKKEKNRKKQKKEKELHSVREYQSL